MGRYDDLLHLQRPENGRHPRMPREERAKQFMPFAALKGYEDAIAGKQQLYERRMELDEESRERLDRLLLDLRDRLSRREHPSVRVSWFSPKPDEPDLGQYLQTDGQLQKLSMERQTMTVDGQTLPLREIVSLVCPEKPVRE